MEWRDVIELTPEGDARLEELIPAALKCSDIRGIGSHIRGGRIIAVKIEGSGPWPAEWIKPHEAMRLLLTRLEGTAP